MLSPHDISTLLVLRHSRDTSIIDRNRLISLEQKGFVAYVVDNSEIRRPGRYARIWCTGGVEAGD
jgi:hypothetical protein